MGLKKYDDKNVNYLHLSIVQLAWFRIMISVMGSVFVGAYIVLMSSNEKLFETRSSRAAMMLWGAAGGMIILGFILTFIQAWNNIREIQEQELAERTQLFRKKEETEEEK